MKYPGHFHNIKNKHKPRTPEIVSDQWMGFPKWHREKGLDPAAVCVCVVLESGELGAQGINSSTQPIKDKSHPALSPTVGEKDQGKTAKQ